MNRKRFAELLLLGFLSYYPLKLNSQFNWEDLKKGFQNFTEQVEKAKKESQRQYERIRRESEEYYRKARKEGQRYYRDFERQARQTWESSKPIVERSFRSASQSLEYIVEHPEELRKVKEVYTRIEEVQNGIAITAIKSIPVYDPLTGKVTSFDKALRNTIESSDLSEYLPEEARKDPVAFAYMLNTNPQFMMNAKLIKSPNGEFVSINQALQMGIYEEEISALLNDYSGMRKSFFNGDARSYTNYAVNFSSRIKNIQQGKASISKSKVISMLAKTPLYGTKPYKELNKVFKKFQMERIEPLVFDILCATGLGLAFLAALYPVVKISGLARRKEKKLEEKISSKTEQLAKVPKKKESHQKAHLKLVKPESQDPEIYELTEEIRETNQEPKHSPELIYIKERLENSRRKSLEDKISKPVERQKDTKEFRKGVKKFATTLSVISFLGISGFTGWYLWKNFHRESKIHYGMGQYCVQVASFLDEEKAIKFKDYLKDLGYDAYVSVGFYKGKAWNRVRIGMFSTKGDALEAREKLINKLPDHKDAFICIEK